VAELTAKDTEKAIRESGFGMAPVQAAYHLPIAIRAAVPADEAFLFSGWLRSLADQPPLRGLLDGRGLDRNWYSAAQHALIARLLSHHLCEEQH